MSGRKPRTSGPSISAEERARRGYGRVTLSLPTATDELINRLAIALDCSRSAVVVQAVDRLAAGPRPRRLKS